jgi:hypothetical protein
MTGVPAMSKAFAGGMPLGGATLGEAQVARVRSRIAAAKND